MFDSITGTLKSRRVDHVVVEVQGIGYLVSVPLSTYQKLPERGTVTLYTALRISEEHLRLYGFASADERDWFVRLVESVSQLGPSKALALLSGVGVEGLRQAVEAGDAETLRGIRGVGPKIAGRLILELRGRLPEAAVEGTGPGGASISREATEGLIALGYQRTEAEEAVRRALKQVKGDVTTEELLRSCLAGR